MSEDNRRKARNIIVDSGALLRFSIPFILLTIVNAAMVLTLCIRVFTVPIDEGMFTSDNLKLIVKLRQSSDTTMMIGASGLLVTGVLCFILWVLYSHRIFGPSVPIRRHIRALCEGKFSARIRLRKLDEFKDIAHDLNELAETLEKSANKKT